MERFQQWAQCRRYLLREVLLRIVIVDSHDSFVHSLALCFEDYGQTSVVQRSSPVQRADLIVLGPGPGHPRDDEHLGRWIEYAAGSVPLFGVCLGMQAIGLHFGANLCQLEPFHGVVDSIRTDDHWMFSGVPSPSDMTRYHSLGFRDLVDPLTVLATSATDGSVQALEHAESAVFGVQFHPESIGSALGRRLIANVVDRALRG